MNINRVVNTVEIITMVSVAAFVAYTGTNWYIAACLGILVTLPFSILKGFITGVMNAQKDVKNR